MLQILGEAMRIATRTGTNTPDHRARPSRPLPEEPAGARERRRGWLHLTGLMM